MPRVLIATWPFGTCGSEPVKCLENAGFELVFNPKQRRLKANEVHDFIADVDAVIAGTEPYDAYTLAHADRLKVIARVGIGLDSVDVGWCQKHKIMVTYTPDAPSDGVAELTIGQILNLLRHVVPLNREVREGGWERRMGRLVSEATIGVVGMGRIGRRVVRLLAPFGARILATDTDPAIHGTPELGVTWCGIDTLLAESDLVTLHIPLNDGSRHFMNDDRFSQMRYGSLLINTSRGPVVDEVALAQALASGRVGGAALDVFQTEPYAGPLCEFENVILTPHIAASTLRTRYLMELGAAQDCVRVLTGQTPAHLAPCE